MPIRHVKSTSDDCTGRVRNYDRMETVWLQRSSAKMPWGFRMIGGSEFDLPLTIQRVTPGSVAAAALSSGDVIIKIGDVMATHLEHSDAQDLVRESGNVLQLTVKKPGGPVLTDSIHSYDSEYGNQLTIQVGDYNAIPKGFGVGIPLNNNYSSNSETTHYATTPRNFGSQHQAYQATKIEIQNVNPAEQRNASGNSYRNDEDMDSGGLNFPDYTLAYQKQDLVHDSPGGPDNIRGYFNSAGNTSYDSKSLPRGVGGYRSNEADREPGSREPETNELRTPNGSLNSVSSNGAVDVKFSTGIPFTASPHIPQQPFVSPVPQAKQYIDKFVSPVPEPIQYTDKFVSPVPQPIHYTDKFVSPVPQPIHYTDTFVSPVPQPIQYTDKFVSPVPQPIQYTDKSVSPVPEPIQYTDKFVSSVLQPIQYIDKFVSPVPEPIQYTDKFVSPVPQPLHYTDKFVSPVPQPIQYTDKSVSPVPQPIHYTDNSTKAAYSSMPRSVGPQTFSGPLSPRQEISSVSQLVNREPSPPSGPVSVQATIYQSGKSDDQSNTNSSGNGTHTPVPNLKPTYNNNNNNSFSVYKSTPQPYSAPKPYTPAQIPASSSFNNVPIPFTSAQFKPTSVIRKVSLDHSAEDSGVIVPPINFTARPFKPVTVSNYSNPAQMQSSNQFDKSNDDNRIADLGSSTQHVQSDILYVATPYTPSGGSLSPRSDFSDDHHVNQIDYPGIKEGVSNLNITSPTEFPLPSPPLPPPPPHFSFPLPPQAPPIWNNVPYKRPNYQQNEESEIQKVPDQILGAVLSSAKSGGPKPFSYGIDLSELKKKIGPPTAPKPKGGQTNQQFPADEPETQDQYGGYRKKSAGQIQSDYYISKEGNQDATFKVPKKPAGQMQSDYLPSQQTRAKSDIGDADPTFKVPKKPVGQLQSDYLPSRQTGSKPEPGDVDPALKASKKPVGQLQADYIPSRQTEPRSQIDESPININMGTNPRKQSKSFKVLQWMTETEQDVPEEPSQKAKRNKDPERRHNADDDEMRFTGLNSKAEIPSKTFGILQRMSSHDELAVIQNGKATLDAGDADEGNGGFEDPALRYKGRNIPSPSFRLLQSWAELEPDPVKQMHSKTEESTYDDYPEVANNEDVADKRYKGSNIPSKVFKVLQKSLGDDPQEISLQQNYTAPGNVLSLETDEAPISEF